MLAKTAVVLLGAAASAAHVAVVSRDRTVSLQASADVPPSRQFLGFSLMQAGWRLRWDGQPAGPGVEIAQFSISARPRTGQGIVTELVQVGSSRDAVVVAGCGTVGLKGDVAQRLPSRMFGGHRWTAYRGSDAGMSQSVAALSLRTVVDGECYAIDRVTYRVWAVETPPPSVPTQAIATARIDRILASIRVVARRHGG